MVSNNNKRIAQNTIFLYLRTILVMLVALYTSRLVLQALGETDLGIYNLVGGIVTMMTFLQAAQTKATSRFITYNLGKGSTAESQKRIFSLCMTIHIIIVLIAVGIAETIGLWIINCWTEIPPERICAANIVYQFSILTFIVHFIRVPYDSVIIAHEKMSIYAYMSILEVLLQLTVVYLVIQIATDSLILYGGLIGLVAFIIFICYAIYVRLKYREYKFHWLWDKKESWEIMKFSGWTLLGSSANTATQQGVSLLFNNFIGLVANTALGFSNQVHTAVGRFVSSFTTAFNPQIVKYYAQQDMTSMHLLMTRAAKFSFVLCYIMALPLIVNMDFILHLWLGNVPMYTTEFCQLILACTVIDATTGIYNTAITATGKIRNYQIGIALSFFLDLICAAFLLILGFHPAIVFGSRIVTRGFINMIIGMYYGEKLLEYHWSTYLKKVLLPVLGVLSFSIPIVYYISTLTEEWTKLISTTFVGFITIILVTFAIVMNHHERSKIYSFITKKRNERFSVQL